MTDLLKFLKVNNLTKKQVADYLGVSEQYFGRAANGHEKLSPAKLRMLKENSAWDSSMLPPNGELRISQKIGSHSNNNVQTIGSESEGNLREINAVLRENIELWRERVKLLEEKLNTLEERLALYENKPSGER